MRIGVDREKIWKSDIVCFPFSPFGYKSEIQSFGAGGSSLRKAKTTHGGGGMWVGVSLGKSRRRRFESGWWKRRSSLGDRTKEIEGLVHTIKVLELPKRGEETSFDVTTLTGSWWGPRASTAVSLILAIFSCVVLCYLLFW
ncbi:hypothetical protein AVEN_58041-1 [Araneus ventricosus]|uniref:Uncharacterized protein n=1 Tax=Araneus ventricosus TaxID=182803 RepID=A0A4Y2J5U8_ARAVE|nr:hypothetical protein AVEN_58041-1 [Araneus ventricosus]